MKRLFPGLHRNAENGNEVLEGVFLVRVERAFYRWHPQKPFYFIRFAVLEPREHEGRVVAGRLYCTPRALWKLNWFLRDFGYDPNLLGRDEIDEKALAGLRGILRTLQSHSERSLLSESRRVCASRRLGRNSTAAAHHRREASP